VLEPTYLEFATDYLRMVVSGNLNASELQVYADHAIAGFVEAGADARLLKTISLTLWASCSGYSPPSTCEFGRQAIR
jgi:flagellar motor component MotA